MFDGGAWQAWCVVAVRQHLQRKRPGEMYVTPFETSPFHASPCMPNAAPGHTLFATVVIARPQGVSPILQ